jgi:predicted dehydrogenase
VRPRSREGARGRAEVRRPASYNRFEELLADDSIEAVDITTPNYLHAPMASAALEAGKHVLCERPLARSGTEAAAWRRRPRRPTGC